LNPYYNNHMDKATVEHSVSTTLGGGARDARMLAGGVGRQTWLCGWDAPSRFREVIVQFAVGDFDRAGVTGEAESIVAARARGVQAPEFLGSGEAADGSAYIITARLSGVNVERFADGQATERLLEQIGTAGARLHAVTIDQVPALNRRDPLDECAALLSAAAIARPAQHLAMRWLEDLRPDDLGPVGLVHGDFRVSNMLVDGDQLTGVLDWELAHIGYVAEDLAWFGMPGWATPERQSLAMQAAYVAAGGHVFDPETFAWWRTVSTLRWSALSVAWGATPDPSPARVLETMAIGERTAEWEKHLMQWVTDRSRAAARA
jgi:aminoglycoside phosphotransferase (APT) family kinase protein